MIVFGLISPHPPIIVPEIRRDDTRRVQTTINALEQAATALGNANPDHLIIIAPHEGHGFEVPLYYLKPHLLTDIQVDQILVTEASYQYYYDLGRTTGAEESNGPRRTAIVASGDLSHVLKADGPYGFNPAGPFLDDLIVEAITRNDIPALLSIDPATLEAGAECGLRSILFLLGALADTSLRPSVRSYEGPFEVGYLVATYEAAS